MRIVVTREDIQDGNPDAFNCPVALAVRRTFGLPYGDVEVNDVIAAGNQEYETPCEVIEFICQFDEGQPVEPFEFDLPE